MTHIKNIYDLCNFRYIKNQKIGIGETGRIAFDANGDRMYAEYDIINIDSYQEAQSIGSYSFSAVSFFLN